MSIEQIEKEIKDAIREDGTFPYEFVKKMNDKGIWFQFTDKGIRWSTNPF